MVMVLETTFNIKTEIIMIQKMFINSQELCHSGFIFY